MYSIYNMGFDQDIISFDILESMLPGCANEDIVD